MRERCGICHGRQTITLPFARPLSAMAYEHPVMENAVRTYPCPECTPLVKQDHVRIIECHFQSETIHERHPYYREYLLGLGIDNLIYEIKKLGFIKMESSGMSHDEQTRSHRISLGVVAPSVVEDADKKREAAEEKFAEKVVEYAIASIDNWGSYYENWSIRKDRAAELIKDALKKAINWRPKSPTARVAGERKGVDMNLFELHEKMTAHLFASYSNTDERFLALALCGEAGELANMIKKRWRDGPGAASVEAIREELADIRVYLELLAKCYGIEGEKLDAEVQKKLVKVAEKHKDKLSI